MIVCKKTLFCALLLFFAAFAQAADISKTQYKDSNLYMIVISGSFAPGDQQKFNEVAAGISKALVVLDSPGGNVYSAIQIGRTIKRLGYSTFIPSKTLCASACALTWLAGSTRFADDSSFIGFHAVYTLDKGVAKESGSGNALVGAYLADLGLSDLAIVYITNAPPEGVERLTKAASEKVGIPYTALNASSVTKTTKSDFGIKVENTPTSVVTAFYRALSKGDGSFASSLVVPEKRGAGPFNEQRISNFYGQMKQPLSVLSIVQTGDDTVEVKYTYRYSSYTCEGNALVTVRDYLGRILISKIKANC